MVMLISLKSNRKSHKKFVIQKTRLKKKIKINLITSIGFF